jgi:cell division protein FtsB
MTDTYEALDQLNIDALRERVLELQNRLLQRRMGEAFYADVCRMEDEIKQLRAQLRRKGGKMGKRNDAAESSLAKVLTHVANLFQPSLTALIRRDPAAFVHEQRTLEMRYANKCQRLAAVRKQNHTLRMTNSVLQNQVDLLNEQLRKFSAAEIRASNLTDPAQADAAGAREHMHASAE